MLGYLLISHLLGLTAVLILPTAWWLTGVFSLTVFFSLVHLARRFQWLSSKTAVKTLKINSDNQCYLTSVDNYSDGPYRISRCVLFDIVIMLYLKRANEDKTTSIVIAKDAVSVQDWRQLRVRLLDPDFWH
jgi:hypothetical protein